MKFQNVLVALTLTSLSFGGVALAKGEKCWDSSGGEVATAKSKKECMKDKTHKWAKPPKAGAAAPAGDTKAAAPADAGAAPAGTEAPKAP